MYKYKVPNNVMAAVRMAGLVAAKPFFAVSMIGFGCTLKLLKNCVQFFGLCISLKLDFYLPYPLLLKVKIMLFKFNLGINRLS